MTAAEKLINDCVSPFNETQRQRLKDLSKIRKDKNYPAAPNIKLEEYIEELRDMYPEKFHTKDTVKHRVFVDEPRSIYTPYARYVRPYAESPIHITPVQA